MLTLAVGTPAITFIGAVGAALAVALQAMERSGRLEVRRYVTPCDPVPLMLGAQLQAPLALAQSPAV